MTLRNRIEMSTTHSSGIAARPCLSLKSEPLKEHGCQWRPTSPSKSIKSSGGRQSKIFSFRLFFIFLSKHVDLHCLLSFLLLSQSRHMEHGRFPKCSTRFSLLSLLLPNLVLRLGLGQAHFAPFRPLPHVFTSGAADRSVRAPFHFGGFLICHSDCS